MIRFYNSIDFIRDIEHGIEKEVVAKDIDVNLSYRTTHGVVIIWLHIFDNQRRGGAQIEIEFEEIMDKEKDYDQFIKKIVNKLVKKLRMVGFGYPF